MMSYAQFLAGMAFNSASLGEPSFFTVASMSWPRRLTLAAVVSACLVILPCFNHQFVIAINAGYVHAMAHQLGGFYDLPHGEHAFHVPC